MDELTDNAICFECVGEKYLRMLIETEGKIQVCSYCLRTASAFTLEDMADRIELAFKQHFQRTASDPDDFERMKSNDPDFNYTWYRAGYDSTTAIMGAADISEEAASELQEILSNRHFNHDVAALSEECEFDGDVHYKEKSPDDREWRDAWEMFERSIKTEARFFSRVAAEQLAALFGDIDKLETSNGMSVIVKAGPQTDLPHFFRARAFHSRGELNEALKRPDLHLAAPPARIAQAGRMNAKGISTFYGATTPEICVAEVRPPVGSKVAIAKFDLIRPLQLLDLNALREIYTIGSIFDPSYARSLGRVTFLRRLCERISRPIMPGDQDSEYLITQAVADYLATECVVPLDGILFPSVQAGGEGVNVVLFHKASYSKELVIRDGAELSVWDNDEPISYMVFETVPARPPPQQEQPPSFPILRIERPMDRDHSMQVDLDSIEVRAIISVSFKANSHPVHRHTWSGGHTPF
ncbi:RES family NAD+ phosphorylase [Rhizobium rhizogenes]|uniref:RES domain-containing protein n=1 Tax=Rhizobium rhizogenes NBRC 13257 TaxID=1220581 RepID=A0AA87Q6L7_RHIRH|nr:RES family NAD+ phosphorylase [Rhizobium rhizogenes]NTG91088.1 RES family NAD+ phosphorylase [Rhizobium rhizogenes]TRB03373.1 RES domain-containing protein [Rhizobium rhizogenes]GAJ96063.1 hypothetical protein RRH01S_16_00130 [Rhizobium rhizogenes NBRC 13257]